MNINTLDTQGYWMVGSSHLYIPSYQTKVEHSNVAGSSTGRSEDGIMRIDWVRRDVRKVFLQYSAMTATELAYTMNLLQGKEFTFTFRDKGTTETMDAYVGDTNYNFYSYANDYLGGEEIYTDVEIHVIEK
jgi:hypothetical protein